MGLPTGEAQMTMITRLRGDTPLQGLLGTPANPPGSIFDAGGIRVNQPFPYIGVFPVSSVRGTGKAMGTDAVDCIMQVSIFTNVGAADAGFEQARGIAKQVYSLLQQQELVLSGGFINFFIQFLAEQEIPERDGLTQHIAQRYLLMMQG